MPARKFIDICQALPASAVVEFGLDDDARAQIRSGRSRFALTTLPANDFPTTDDVADESVFMIAQNELKRLIDLTHFAMARQDVRYYLNGLLFEVAPERIKAVATDGHRLAVAQFETVTGMDESKSFIVPRKGVLELARLVTSEESELRVRVGTNAVQLEIGNVRFTSKLIDGRFPDYGRVIPEAEACDKQLSMDRESLRQCLVRTSVLSSDKHRTVRLTFDSGVLTVAANNPEQETAVDELEIAYGGERLEIGFNVSYLIDALAILPSETADIFLHGFLQQLPDPASRAGQLSVRGDAHATLRVYGRIIGRLNIGRRNFRSCASSPSRFGISEFSTVSMSNSHHKSIF